MSRTQDLVAARLRILAARWWPAPEAGALALAEAGVAASVDGSRRHGEPEPAEHVPGEPGPGPDLVDTDGDPPGAAGPSAGESDPPAAGLPRTWLALGGLACAAALIVAGGLAVRGWPRAQPQPTAAESAPVDLRPLGEPSPSASVVVHVAGEVREPGVVELPAGARVADALRAAGGLRRGGRLGPTNLARVVADGERIEIGGQAGDPAGGGTTSGGGPVDLNTATSEQLDALPGVGPVTAAKILAWRAEHGRFAVVDELAEVPGIGPKTLEELRPLVKV